MGQADPGAIPDWALHGWSGFEFRDLNGSLLLGAYVQKPYGEERIYSGDHYAVNGRGAKYELRMAEKVDWDSAKPLLQYARDLLTKYPNGPLTYKGRHYNPRGPYWARAQSSQERSAYPYKDTSPDPFDSLLVGGYDGSVANGDLATIQLFAADGRYVFDLYQASTGRKYATIKGKYHGIDPRVLGYGTFWIGGPRFVFPLGIPSDEFRRVLICDLPKLTP